MRVTVNDSNYLERVLNANIKKNKVGSFTQLLLSRILKIMQTLNMILKLKKNSLK